MIAMWLGPLMSLHSLLLLNRNICIELWPRRSLQVLLLRLELRITICISVTIAIIIPLIPRVLLLIFATLTIGININIYIAFVLCVQYQSVHRRIWWLGSL